MRVVVQALEAEVLDGLSGDNYRNAVEALEKILPRGDLKVEDHLGRPMLSVPLGESLSDEAVKQAFFKEVEAYRKVVEAKAVRGTSPYPLL